MLYIVAAVAESKRIPFDIPEAESEIVAGYHTEYSGMKFGFFFLGHSPLPLTIADPIPGFIWLMAKALAVILVMMWIRWTLPRLRVDQLMKFAWKGLVPLGFVAIAVAGLAIGLGLAGGGG